MADDYSELLALCEKATPGTWSWIAYGGRPNDHVIALTADLTDANVLLCTGDDKEAWGTICVRMNAPNGLMMS